MRNEHCWVKLTMSVFWQKSENNFFVHNNNKFSALSH